MLLGALELVCPLQLLGGGVACRVGCVWARDARIVQAKGQSTVLSAFEVHLALRCYCIKCFYFYYIFIFLNPSLGLRV